MKHASGAVGILPHQLLGKLEPNPKRHEALLAAVMKIALDAAALLVRRGEYASSGRAQLGQRGLNTLGQAAIVVPDERVRPDHLDKGALVAQGGVVDDRRHRLPLIEDQGGTTVEGWRRQGGRPPIAVDPTTAAVDSPERQLDRRV